MTARKVEWSPHGDPDLFIDVWSKAALMESVLDALLEDPLAVERARKALAPSAVAEP